jgi:protein SCO1/2
MRVLPSLLLAFLSFSVVLAGGAEQRPPDEVPDIRETPEGGSFRLQSLGGEVSLDGLRGKVVMLYFGYTRCPDVCPTSLSFLTQALNQLNDEELTQVQGVFVSVDPKRDSLEMLDEYVRFFHPNLVGVTGSPEEVADVAERYGAKYYEVELKGSAFGYAVNHSAATYLITPDGQLRFVFPHETSSLVMLEAIRYVLSDQ